MSSPVAILGTIAVGYAVSKLTEKLTGSETLGMVAGLAAGGWAGSAIAGYQAAGVAGTAATTAGKSGSALGIANLGTTSLGTTSPTAASTFGNASQFASMAGSAPGVIPPVVPPPVVPPPASSSFLGFSTDELLKVAASGISGWATSQEKEKDREVAKDYQRLLEEREEEAKRQYYAKSAYGVTNAGRVVPINAGQQLKDMNQRLGYQPHTNMGTMTNLSTVQRPDGGYVSEFGRFSKDTQNA